MDETLQKEIQARRLDILFQQSFINLMMTTVLAVSMTYAFRQQLSANLMMAWLSIFFLTTGIRLYSARVFLRAEGTSPNLDYWFVWHIFSVFVSGTIWGAFILLLVRTSDPASLSITIICASGLCAGAMAAYSYSFLSFVVFVVPILGPLGFFLVMEDYAIINTLAYFNFLFLIAIITISWHLNKTTMYSLTMQIERQNLLTSLETEKRHVVELNKNLEEDIRKKTQTEATLLSEKKNAESLTEALRAISTQDALTGINNRRRFNESLYDEWYRAARLSSSLSLIMCDIDKFKEYNDTYGHLQGDKCLTRIAHLIEDYARRAGDMAARFGGEEFAIILPDTKQAYAEEIAEQIRVAIVDLELPHGASPIANFVTASFGVHTAAPDKKSLPETLIEFADKALYQAKLQGRNKVVFYKDSVAVQA